MGEAWWVIARNYLSQKYTIHLPNHENLEVPTELSDKFSTPYMLWICLFNIQW